MERVSVQHEFEYTAKDGCLVSIKPNESYILVSKTNEYWWHVRKDQHTRPFYVPAQYVKELTEGCPGPTKLDSSECGTDSKPVDMVTRIRGSSYDGSRETYRFSTFGLCEDKPDVKPCETLKEKQSSSSSAHFPDNKKTNNSTGGLSFTSAHLNTDDQKLYAKPHPVPKVRNGQQTKSSLQDDEVEQSQTFLLEEDMDFPLPPNLPIYDTIPELNVTDFDIFSDLPAPVASDDPLMFEQQNLNERAETSSTDVPPNEQAENENLRSAVYVNVGQLRKSISESPPSAPSSYSPSYFNPEGWEAHVDEESGQEYYYHPATGRTTWDNPFLDSPTDPEPLTSEEPCSPSPPQSPAFSLSTASPPAWTSDWEQLVDETSGRPYFYNPMSGETSWEPPEQLSPYPPLMEPMSVHRFHEDGPPSLPEEDYPPEDYPAAEQDAHNELLATGPPTLPKEFALSHGSNTIIPRACLDRSTPTGWNLTVEHNGTWVFTSEHSPEQWIKSVDDRGQTFYYLRDGSKSQWSLPEAPVGHGLSRMENGVDAHNASVIKNWRQSMGPAQLGSAQDDGRFVPTHRRKTSDYGSDSSSTGNSPETQQNVQNLEKAGILNKTKVSENGKKVRKNWTQTWTVLLGGVLTFHKDPKSAATGALNKTNQIVPEVTVDLRGATIGWASKDKSSKKNVLELKGKNGVEFLIQYDTESIINDWHKVLVDTIRQLEYQDHHSEEEDENLYEKITCTERDDKFGGSVDKRRSSRPSVAQSSGTAGDADQKRVRTKLMKFLMKRPTLQSVKEKGYIRDNVFGCHLATLCEQEKDTVPSFVVKCIKAVENRGLDIDGLYRVSGNLAVIQKLRFKADHEELDLEDGQWEDVHVITGALKLFFRELPEPLFPYSHFNNFISAIRISDYNSKLSCMYELVKSLPSPNHDTMKLLFGHLRRVIQYGEDNRMTVQNVAIVFGPTLLRPEMESSNIAMHMIFQNQIVEFILNEYERLFHNS
ncbi:rho GTPase-activating protein 27 isoform X1 [Micropterus salmoides]|uniref:rho GTPase-activating protein 27 isoform X1 n=1 Tax=Micropterus salmoides TaxID=27706 RepID=UPI0018EAE065|nr:rho GTPase-activating protein 27 isoform X1 [Micropterus salmoides]XP_038591789.1 rho GTPase-activating protein 27 isoform X1 [Micropterus salmoides]XP_038591790.1 rho GTPase-activating protein 27 isoform X1 [Micropterus salmoides]